MSLKWLPVAILLSAIPSYVAAQAVYETKSYRVVTSGQSAKIATFTPVDQDCRSRGSTTANVLGTPEGGTVEIRAGSAYPSFPTTDVRSHCNHRLVPATLVFYHATTGFFGDDAVVLEIIDPEGRAWRVRYPLSVR